MRHLIGWSTCRNARELGEPHTHLIIVIREGSVRASAQVDALIAAASGSCGTRGEVAARRDAAAGRQFFHRALNTLKVMAGEVVTDAAPVYPAVLTDLLPAAWHHVGPTKPVTCVSAGHRPYLSD